MPADNCKVRKIVKRTKITLPVQIFGSTWVECTAEPLSSKPSRSVWSQLDVISQPPLNKLNLTCFPCMCFVAQCCRRRGILTDTMLQFLVDESWCSLDLAKPFNKPALRQPGWLSETAICDAARTIGHNLQVIYWICISSFASVMQPVMSQFLVSSAHMNVALLNNCCSFASPWF